MVLGCEELNNSKKIMVAMREDVANCSLEARGFLAVHGKMLGKAQEEHRRPWGGLVIDEFSKDSHWFITLTIIFQG